MARSNGDSQASTTATQSLCLSTSMIIPSISSIPLVILTSAAKFPLSLVSPTVLSSSLTLLRVSIYKLTLFSVSVGSSNFHLVSAYKSQKYLSDVDSLLAGGTATSGEVMEDYDDVEDVFQPQKGNVVFACALDGWGFGIHEFAEIYASKLGASVSALQKALWGPRYFNPKTKMIVGKKGISGGGKAKPMFVQFVLKPLWQVYQGALEGDKGLLEKVIKSFNLQVPARELQNKDPKVVLQAVMSRWLPLSNAILSMVVKCMPDSIEAQSSRISRLIPQHEVIGDEVDEVDRRVVEEAEVARKSVERCDWSPEVPCVPFVAKMFALPVKMLPPQGGDLCSELQGRRVPGKKKMLYTATSSGLRRS